MKKWDHIIEVLEKMKQNPESFSDKEEGVLPPSLVSIDSAIKLVKNAEKSGIEPYGSVGPDGDGGICMQKAYGLYCDLITINKDGTYESQGVVTKYTDNIDHINSELELINIFEKINQDKRILLNDWKEHNLYIQHKDLLNKLTPQIFMEFPFWNSISNQFYTHAMSWLECNYKYLTISGFHP